MTPVWYTTPDMLVSTFAYLIFATIIHLKIKGFNFCTSVLMGILFGLGFLVKTVMFPFAFVFLFFSSFLIKNVKKKLFYIFIVFLVFSLISGPFIYVLSKKKGFFSFGESGKLSYAWFINNVPYEWDWYERVPGAGTPLHPLKKIHRDPPIYYFGDDFKNATYPVAYDISYWWDGVKVKFDIKQQLGALPDFFRDYYFVFLDSARSEIVYILLFLLFASGRGNEFFNELKRNLFLLLPSIIGVGIYLFVVFEKRYIPGFLIVMWLILFASLRLAKRAVSGYILSYAMLTLVVIMLLRFLLMGSNYVSLIVHDFKSGKEANEMWVVANELNKTGLSRGDKVATISDESNQYWARIAGLRIVAEVSPEDYIDEFWGLSEGKRLEAIKVFSNTGAKALVTPYIPEYALNSNLHGWKRIDNTNYHVYSLSY